MLVKLRVKSDVEMKLAQTKFISRKLRLILVSLIRILDRFFRYKLLKGFWIISQNSYWVKQKDRGEIQG